MKREKVVETYNKDNIKAMLESNPKAVLRAIQAIYKYQTKDEQMTQDTHEINGVGFNGVDASILSSFAEQINRTGTLSTKQFAIAQKKIMKYAGQLAKISNQNLLEKNKEAS